MPYITILGIVIFFLSFTIAYDERDRIERAMRGDEFFSLTITSLMYTIMGISGLVIFFVGLVVEVLL